MNQTDEMEFCMKCGEENPVDRKACSCGGRNFVFGRKFSYKDKKVVCDCGCETFKLALHINKGTVHDHKYTCSSCQNVIGVQYYMGDDKYEEK